MNNVPQSTVSRIEQGKQGIGLSTLKKVFSALSCDLVIAPVLQDSIETLRRKQARKMAEKQMRYLQGTMNLEDQQPDSRFIEALLKQEEERLCLHSWLGQRNQYLLPPNVQELSDRK